MTPLEDPEAKRGTETSHVPKPCIGLHPLHPVGQLHGYLERKSGARQLQSHLSVATVAPTGYCKGCGLL